MRSHAPARVGLAAAGLAVALRADGPQTATCAALILAGFILAREGRSALRLLAVTLPLLALVAALWLVVLAGPWRGPAPSLGLIEPSSRFLRFARALVGSGAIVLGLATLPDGELYGLLRQLGLRQELAVVIASGAATVGGVGDALNRAMVALRANGQMGAHPLSRLACLGDLVALTWVSSLSVAVGRAECKWRGNGFLVDLVPPPVRARVEEAWGTTILAAVAASLVTILTVRIDVDHLL